MARLFFAVWPGEAASPALARLAREVAQVCEGKPVAREKIHLTLAFLGEVPASRIDAARAAAAAIRFAAFAFTLDRVGSFRAAHVAWAGCREAPAALGALQSSLAETLRAARFELEDRPFTAHATVARRIGKALPPAAIEAIDWPVHAFTLVRSESGTGRYGVVEEFPAR